ncbi:MAG: succinate dehydrogenase, cytochrome b556 subunit [Rhodospirillales bacterium]|nr:succinate dehydrogenase, cytochrome b556 subunit [Rhodospirillales bacterium]MCB9996723.1 succinate dehydrogenase, cytochrome b556 subunit [Rhodospirillales bacterium]
MSEPAQTQKAAGPKPRPLSPHLQVYKPQLTSVMSITHRATGYALSIGLVMLTWMLLALASGPAAYETFLSFAGSGVGQLLLFGWSLALFYHLCNGVRHLLWDMGYLFKIEKAYKAGYIVLLFTVILTAYFWWSVSV